jgi:AAA15 family ATPase/GTPase
MRKNLTGVIYMLKSFQISNFNSVNEPIVFSMEPVAELSEHLDYITHLDTDNALLKVASIYGPNASGKSNVLNTLSFVKDFVYGYLSREYIKYSPYLHATYSPFAFTHEDNRYVEASLTFARPGKEYWYHFRAEYINENSLILKIIDEFFGVKHQGEQDYNFIFQRENDVINADQILKTLGATKLPLSNDMVLLRYLYMNYINIDETNNNQLSLDPYMMYVKELFEEITSLTFLSNLSDMSKNVFKRNGDFINKYKLFIIESLKRLDIQITDIEVEEIGKRNYQVLCVHEVDGKKYKLRVEQESQGTTLLIYLLAMVASRKNRPTIFIIDELDSHLHPKLIQEIIALFNSNINQYNQLLFNSHDMWNMVPEQFRRDQIWFTYRNEYLATELVCLSDIINYKGERVRKDAKFSKQYMEGKYGADPFIRKGLDWYGL